MNIDVKNAMLFGLRASSIAERGPYSRPASPHRARELASSLNVVWLSSTDVMTFSLFCRLHRERKNSDALLYS